MNPFDDLEYGSQTLELLATNLKDPDVLHVFQQVWKFRERNGFKKTYLPDWSTKRRRYDNSFLILEATRFIYRDERGSSNPYFPTIRGKQLALYLINDIGMDKSGFVKLNDEQFVAFMSARGGTEQND
ncbi:hypothetical protein DFQ01_103199 [Paenibacillus cellulosilyticus]|uniref:Uncharacterized protein n=1 Tax=Paenibacillus cellulosilyticus TaxID=375489 RepID=A0A2V2YX18_9BACL|nr:hypothetical protein [Paenibacillus cellulosilyticus]PWW06297.1 hypothetical protein DFQ01_103199 [Paenibacillus cellulosilyticus]QKS42956.1 hypothetical protein HUB94_00200 [Paenibacillus cellulosilyticus]QKS43479.1 hypothetical protein HUB94_02865 [Paenibacillus cellulosilyticus]